MNKGEIKKLLSRKQSENAIKTGGITSKNSEITQGQKLLDTKINTIVE